MKRFGYIYEKIYTRENISAAIDRAAQKKKKRRAVQRALANKEDCIDEIQYLLITESYRPSPYREKIIREVRQTAKKKSWNPHNCKSILSYLGWFQHADNYKMYQQWVKPYINVRRMKGVVRRESIKRCNAGKGFSGAA